MLGAISAPVLMLRGSDAKPFMTRSVQHVTDHVPNARIQEIPGAGACAPLTRPEPLANALTEFFSPGGDGRPADVGMSSANRKGIQ